MRIRIQLWIRIQIQAKSEHIFVQSEIFYVLSMKLTFYKRYSIIMFLNTRKTFYDELSVFMLCFSPKFRLASWIRIPNADQGS
jgi:hypothetical protein